MSPFRSIKGKLLIFTLCISLIPIAIIMTMGYFHARHTIKRETLEWMTSVAASRKLYAVSLVDAKKARTIDFSSDGFIRDSLEEIEREGFLGQETVNALNRHLLVNKMPLDPYIAAIEVVDRDGRVVAATSEAMIGRNISDQDIFTQVIDEVYSRAYVGRAHTSPFLDIKEIDISAPLTSRRGVETIGVIINHYDLTFLNEIVVDRTGMGKTGEVLLGDRRGDDIVFLTSLRYVPDAPLTLQIPIDSSQAEPMRLALEGGSGALIVSDYKRDVKEKYYRRASSKGVLTVYDYRGVEVVAAYHYMRSLDWGLVAKIDETEVFAPLKTLGIVALIVGLISAAAVACIAISFAISASRPIKKLTEATRKFAGGDLAQRVDIRRKDEIGELAQGFNAMAGGLEEEISKRERRELELRKLSLVVEHSPNMVIITDPEGTIEYVNPKFTQVTGYAPEEAVGKTPRILKSGRTSLEEYKRLWETIKSGKDWRGIFCNRRKDGEIYWESVFISPVKDAEGVITNFIAVKEDVTERRKTEETIHKMAYYDPLTGLPNRILFNDRLTLAIAHARRYKQMVAVMFLDLDRFKDVNDTLGHTVGDQLLKHVAERLKGSVREDDTVARLGGDEFTLLLPGVANVEDASKVAEKIIKTTRRPFKVDGHELYITTSIGVALYPDDGLNSEDLLRNADAAMYHAKEEGRDNCQFYVPTFHAKASERVELESGLHGALEREEFVIHYQPQVDIGSKRIVGVEALLRWRHPRRGLLAPGEFISAAENTGLIVPIGEWVLRKACAQNKAWQDAGIARIRMAVNLSPRQFQQPNLVDMVSQVLKETGLNPQLLELEITEGATMQNIETAIDKLFSLNALGVRIAIDDFGTGYSSLGYLKRFPIHTLKVAQYFMHGIPKDPDVVAIVTAVIAMAKGLKLKVIAEGVETEEQLEFLKRLGCEEMQGYLFSKPLTAEAFKDMLAQEK